MMRWSSCLLLLVLFVALACGKRGEREPSTPGEEQAPGTPGMAAPEPARDEDGVEGESAAEGSVLDQSRADDRLARAQAELERAEDELELVLGPAPSAAPAPAAPAAGEAPATAAPRRSRAAGAPEDDASKPKADKKAGETSCQTACRAFQSLGRAAASICRLAGDGDERCEHARSVVARAERRVAACGCPGP
jgi:hypothetical protein